MLLAGLGGSAHTFDDLAPQLTGSFHVIGITRRGTGESDRPAAGYDVPSRALDDIDVLDSLRISSALFVGHSIAGDELTELATRFPQRVSGLVYLDAAYDRTSVPATNRAQLLRRIMRPPRSLSFEQLLDTRRHSRTGLPKAMETDLRIVAGDKDGDLISSPPATIFETMIREEKQWHPDYARIKVPATAIYAFSPEQPTALADLWPPDSAERANGDSTWRAEHWPWQREEITRFQREDPSVKVIVLNPADHAVYFSNPREVVAAIRAFLPLIARGDSLSDRKAGNGN